MNYGNGDYYFGFIPRIDAMLFPLFVFISVIFFTSKMATRSEVIAILSSGVSFRRFLRPYVIGGIFLSALLWIGYQYVVPRANKKWGDFESKYIDPNFGNNNGNSTRKEKIYFKMDSNTYVGIRGYDTVLKLGSGFFTAGGNNLSTSINVRSGSSGGKSQAEVKIQIQNLTKKFGQRKAERLLKCAHIRR